MGPVLRWKSANITVDREMTYRESPTDSVRNTPSPVLYTTCPHIPPRVPRAPLFINVCAFG
jgi:hypothetical protein